MGVNLARSSAVAQFEEMDAVMLSGVEKSRRSRWQERFRLIENLAAAAMPATPSARPATSA
jgi:hypothetical protein